LIHAEKEKRLAVFLQPCFIKAVRKMQENEYPNIRYIISFFCGFNVTKEATDYLIKKTGVNKENIEEIYYRWGPYPGGFMLKTKHGRITYFGKECYELVDLMFLRTGCKECSLYMGEGADIVLGDAWVKSLPNASLVITRTDKGADIIERMKKGGEIELYKIKEKDLIQMHWHNLRYKKYGMGFFLNFMHHILKTKFMKQVAPFKLFMILSKIRRRFAIGVNIELEKG
jgi:coenzyme F420-reducing hydrogenase beta subunit